MARDNVDNIPDRDSNENLMAQALEKMARAIEAQTSQQEKIAKEQKEATKQAIKESAQAAIARTDGVRESTRSAMADIQKGWDGSGAYKTYMSKELESLRKSLKKELDDLEVLASSTHGNSKESKGLQESIDNLRQAIKDVEDANDDANKPGKSIGETFKKIGMNFLKDFRDFTNRNIKRYIDESTKQITAIGTTYRQTYTAITARQEYTQGEYKAAINGMQQWIEDNGLTDQLSLNDILPKLEETLAQGLRGQIAVTQAQYASIASDVVPALDMNNRSLLQTVNSIDRQGGDAADFYNTLFGTITDSADDLGNAFGMEAGILNQTIQGVGNMIKGMGLNETQSIQTYQAFIRATSALESINVDSSTLITDMSNMMNKSVVDYSTYEHVLRQSGVSAEKLAAAMESGDEKQLTEIFANYQHAQEQMFGRYFDEMGNVIDWDGLQIAANNVYGSNLSVQDIVSLFKNEFDYEEVMSKIGHDFGIEEYTKGDYQTKNEKYQNKVANAFDDMTIGMENSFAYGTEILADGFDTLWNRLEKSLDMILLAIYATAFNKTSGGGLFNTTGGQSFASKVGTSWTSGKLGNTFAKIGSKGTKFTGTGAKWAGVARVGGGIGGAIMMGADAIEAWNSTKENGGSTDEALGNAVIGAFTGVTDTPDSGWEVAGNTVKNAGKGAMIGTAILPGWGTAIGAGVGAVLGLVDSLTRYNSTQAKLERSAKSLEEAFQKSSEATKTYNEGTKQTASLQESLNIIKNKEQHTTSQVNNAFQTLKSSYNDLLYNVEDVSELDEQYVDLLQYKIDKENRLLQDEFSTDAADAASDRSSGINGLLDALNGKSDNVLKSSPEAAAYTEQFLNKLNSGTSAHNAIWELAFDKYGEDATAEEFEAMANTLAPVINTGIDGGYVLDKAGKQNSDGTITYNYVIRKKDSKGVAQDISTTSEDYTNFINNGLIATKGASGEDQKAIDEIKEELAGYATDLKTLLGVTTFDDLKNVKLNETSKSNVEKILEKYNQNAKDLKSKAAKIPGDNGCGEDTLAQFINDKTQTSEAVYTPKALSKVFDLEDTPAFATGLEKVPYDNYPALLHKDERVQTAAEVRMQTLEERVRELLDNGTTRTTTETVVNTDSPNTVNAVTNQTQTLSQKLDIMIELLGQLVGMPVPTKESNGLKSFRNFNSNISNIPAMAE